jgi:hypothetical protein
MKLLIVKFSCSSYFQSHRSKYSPQHCVSSKGFWLLWCTLCITSFLNIVHYPIIWSRVECLRSWTCFCFLQESTSSMELVKREVIPMLWISSFQGVVVGTVSNNTRTWAGTHMIMSRSSCWNAVFCSGSEHWQRTES